MNVWESTDDTPNVDKGNFYSTNNKKATKITAIEKGTEGQQITILILDNLTTLQHGGAQKNDDLTLSQASNWLGAAGDTITLIYTGKFWYETGRSDNTKSGK